jgi:hypothetical protein
MQGFWNKLFTIWCECYQGGFENITSVCKTAIDKTSYLKNTHIHTTMLFTIQLILKHIPKWQICDQPHSDTYHTSLCDEAELFVSVSGDTNGVKRRIRQRGTTTITTEAILHSNTLLSQLYPYCQSNTPTVTAIFLLSQQYHYCHSNTPTVTAISLLSQQYPYCHSNTPTVTAISLLSQQYPYCHSNIPTVTAISLLSQQYPYCHSNIPTVTHNSKHYSVQTAGRCNTPGFVSSLVIELPRQSVATDTDFSSKLFISCFVADIPVLVQTNWYYQLYLAH